MPNTLATINGNNKVLHGKKTTALLATVSLLLSSLPSYSEELTRTDIANQPLVLTGKATNFISTKKNESENDNATQKKISNTTPATPKKITPQKKPDTLSIKSNQPAQPVQPVQPATAKKIDTAINNEKSAATVKSEKTSDKSIKNAIAPEKKITLKSENKKEVETKVQKSDYPQKPIDTAVGDISTTTGNDLGKIDSKLKVIQDNNLDIDIPLDDKKEKTYTLDEIKNPKSRFYSNRGLFIDNNNIRNTALIDAAKGVGVRAGYYNEAERINKYLLRNYSDILDKRFSFFFLMLGNGKVIPPVITEVKDQQERSGGNFLYLSIGSYEIVKPATLTLKAPTWKDYLIMPVSDPRPPEGLRAENDKEIKAWERAVQIGWEEGKREARKTFLANLNRLIRDYTGMQRYHALAKKGAITIPKVQSIKNKQRVDGDRLFVGEERLELKVSAKFRR